MQDGNRADGHDWTTENVHTSFPGFLECEWTQRCLEAAELASQTDARVIDTVEQYASRWEQLRRDA